MAMLTLWAHYRASNLQGDCQDPAKLRCVIVDLIDAENWSSMSTQRAVLGSKVGRSQTRTARGIQLIRLHLVRDEVIAA